MARDIKARAFGAPFRYVQGPGELDALPAHLAPYGRRLLAVIDPFLLETVSRRLQAVFGEGELAVERFGGECSVGEIDRLTAVARERRAEVVSGIGGGKTLDAAKLAAFALGLPVAVVPTSASTDAPVSALGVVCGPDGRRPAYRRLPHAPELVVVDTRLVAKAPPRLFAAGVGDALSTWHEAEAGRLSGALNQVGEGYRPTLAARALARACLDTVKGRAAEAVRDLAEGRLTEAVEDVIEANILLSGLGFENTGRGAAAHALQAGLHELPGSGAVLHGEMVAFGIVFQLVLEKAPEAEIVETADFLASLGLPICLADLGLAVGGAEIDLVAAAAAAEGSGLEAEPFETTPELVKAALSAADRLGRRRRGLRPDLPPAWCSPEALARRG